LLHISRQPAHCLTGYKSPTQVRCPVCNAQSESRQAKLIFEVPFALSSQSYHGETSAPKRNAATETAASKAGDIVSDEIRSLVKRKALTFRRRAPGNMAMAGYRITPHPTCAASFKSASPNNTNNAGAKGNTMSERSKVSCFQRYRHGAMSAVRIARSVTAR